MRCVICYNYGMANRIFPAKAQQRALTQTYPLDLQVPQKIEKTKPAPVDDLAELRQARRAQENLELHNRLLSDPRLKESAKKRGLSVEQLLTVASQVDPEVYGDALDGVTGQMQRDGTSFEVALRMVKSLFGGSPEKR